MKRPTFIQKLINKYNEYEYHKPKYTIKNLYCGKIGQLLNIEDFVLINGNYTFKPTQEFAIFYKKLDGTYVHISSQKRLPHIQDANIGDEVVDGIQSFEDVYGDGMPFLRLTCKSKISKGFIEGLENKANKKISKEEFELGV